MTKRIRFRVGKVPVEPKSFSDASWWAQVGYHSWYNGVYYGSDGCEVFVNQLVDAEDGCELRRSVRESAGEATALLPLEA